MSKIAPSICQVLFLYIICNDILLNIFNANII
uniref:Uncharacterized protein n=1 Tax=Siphoviridae sp. ctxvK3 TaxID=2827975 RepID=A0A8S5SGA7_9CAUD|nr:MAG TPA: hypothetical protein [Siphoviridae sp. ctxvK3]